MKIKQLLVNYYQILQKDSNESYNTEGVRCRISSEAEVLLNILDKKEQQGVRFDYKIFSFLNFINGYDTPRYEDDGYLYNNIDLEREYKMLGDIDALKGADTEIYPCT